MYSFIYIFLCILISLKCKHISKLIDYGSLLYVTFNLIKLNYDITAHSINSLCD